MHTGSLVHGVKPEQGALLSVSTLLCQISDACLCLLVRGGYYHGYVCVDVTGRIVVSLK